MSQEGARIEFTDQGPYVFPELCENPTATVLAEQGIVVARFGALHIPMTMEACSGIIQALIELRQSPAPPDESEAISLILDGPDMAGIELIETPVLTSAVSPALQHDDLVYLSVGFGDTAALFKLSIGSAGLLGQLLSRVPEQAL